MVHCPWQQRLEEGSQQLRVVSRRMEQQLRANEDQRREPFGARLAGIHVRQQELGRQIRPAQQQRHADCLLILPHAGRIIYLHTLGGAEIALRGHGSCKRELNACGLACRHFHSAVSVGAMSSSGAKQVSTESA